MKATGECYDLTLRAEPGYDVPGVVRLRDFLKHSLRRYGLRCMQAKRADGQAVEVETEATASTTEQA